MSLPLRLLLNSLLLMVGLQGFSQTPADKGCKFVLSRELWHDRINREQKNALKADGRADMSFHAGNNEDINYHVTQTLIKRVDDLQCRLDKDSLMHDQQKVTYIKGVEYLLRNFISMYKSRQFSAANFPKAFDTYELAIVKDLKKESIEQLIEQSSYEIGKLVITTGAFDGNIGINTAKNTVFRKYCILHPDQILSELYKNPNVPFRDSLIILAGYKYPKRLYDFASANNELGRAIRKVNEPFIKAISKMATSGGSGQLYFPFLDNLTAGRISFEDINAVKDDETKYYKLLVSTKMDYVTRSLDGEKILSMGVLDTMLQRKGRDYFVKTINALHEEQPPVRFKILQPLSAQELYYLVIAGERDMYTSSYTAGIFPLMMQKIRNRGDSLLMSVSFDRFKKFIKVAAGYNTLSEFLGSFGDKEYAQLVMRGFVNGLEKSTGLEDGVDVADSYSSIAESPQLKAVAEEMLVNVKANYDRNVQDNNKRGMVMYNLLYKLFLSADSTKKIDLSKEFGIPPVYNVSYQSLKQDSLDKVNIQVFFYGDKDGRMNFSGFTPSFANSNWKKIEDNKYWVAYTSTKGKPIVIYANKPLDETTGELEKAQEAVNRHLEEKGIQPTIVVHRGHSYYAPYTIEQVRPAAKIVLLGSCGGYNLVNNVLQHAPDAHIIASKQVGKKDINQPFMDILNEKLRNGASIDWRPFWSEFRQKAGKVDGFEDYIPPYKNLGAIFIKAYTSSMGENEL
ncbi:MAG TPA: hypothetical protein VFR58_14730 [Flavisolibacter sp.]|nr:hypothetical protein [Flavisolibacter sp.]